MKIKFCGAAGTVTGSCHLLTLDDGFKILLDCGLYQGREDKFNDFNSKWFFDPSTIDCLVLSHAHIDHSGRIPKLVKDGFSGTILCTSATRDLCAVMLLDSAKIQERDAYYINKRNKKNGLPEDEEPLYTADDVNDALKHFVGVSYKKSYHLNTKISVVFRDAGHIFGSASVTLRIEREERDPIYLGFSGDIGRPGRPILKDPVSLKNLDYLICESTYGGQTHNDLPQDEEALLEIINETCVEKKGKLIIPAFSVGRTQEIVYMLDRLETSGKLPKISVYVDSPMAVNATEIFRLHPECFDSQILEYMTEDPNPFGFNDLKYIKSSDESKKLNNLKGPSIIISASGMMTGGRIVHHLLNHIGNPNNTLLIVGYCAPHTLGAKIRRGDKEVWIHGNKREVNAKVVIMDSYSAHGDQNEMIEYLSELDKKKLKQIFLVHGDPERQELFKNGLLKEGYNEVIIPNFKDEFNID
ncbi:MAG: MBL fold metallo-hydrolase RNA specificity domain-containing protein [Thermodesulfobacteriota bacterium]